MRFVDIFVAAVAVASVAMGADVAAASGTTGSRTLEPVIRFRGGPSFENNERNTGPAWFGGASAGVLIARTAMATIGADRISLDDARVATPVMLQIELARPFRSRVTPRLLGGWGPWFVQAVQTSAVDFFGAPPPGLTGTDTYLGGYLGAGFSVRIMKNAMLDFGLRYQQARNKYYVLNLDTMDAGLTVGL